MRNGGKFAKNVTAITELCAGLKHTGLTSRVTGGQTAEVNFAAKFSLLSLLADPLAGNLPLAVALLPQGRWTKASVDAVNP